MTLLKETEIISSTEGHMSQFVYWLLKDWRTLWTRHKRWGSGTITTALSQDKTLVLPIVIIVVLILLVCIIRLRDILLVPEGKLFCSIVIKVFHDHIKESPMDNQYSYTHSYNTSHRLGAIQKGNKRTTVRMEAHCYPDQLPILPN